MRAISCSCCGKYLGEIRDAKLRKGMAFLCEGCERMRAKTNEMLATMARHEEPSFFKDWIKQY